MAQRDVVRQIAGTFQITRMNVFQLFLEGLFGRNQGVADLSEPLNEITKLLLSGKCG